MFNIPPHGDPREFGDPGLQQENMDVRGTHVRTFAFPQAEPEMLGAEPPVKLEKVALTRTRHPVGFNAHTGRNLYSQYLVELALRRREKAEFLEPFEKAASLPVVDPDPEPVWGRLEEMQREAMRKGMKELRERGEL